MTYRRSTEPRAGHYARDNDRSRNRCVGGCLHQPAAADPLVAPASGWGSRCAVTPPFVAWIWVVGITVVLWLWRWRQLSRRGALDWRRELFVAVAGVLIIAVGGLITISGPVAQSLVPPVLVLPGSVYLLSRRDVAHVGIGALTIRNAAWLSLLIGIFGVIRVVLFLVWGHG